MVAIVIWAILIFIIAVYCCPGFLTCILTIGGIAAVITFVYAYFKTKKDIKENQKLLDEIPPQPWDDEL